MKITIKKLKTMPTFDFDAISCEVYVDGVKVGYAYDDGRGGELDFQKEHQSRKALDMLKKVEEYVLTLPKKTISLLDDKTYTYSQTFISLINDAIDAELKLKEDKKLNAKMLKGIVYGNPNSTSYYMISWKNKTLVDLLKHPNGRKAIENAITQAKNELKENEKIINAEYLRSLGFIV